MGWGGVGGGGGRIGGGGGYWSITEGGDQKREKKVALEFFHCYYHEMCGERQKNITRLMEDHSHSVRFPEIDAMLSG